MKVEARVFAALLVCAVAELRVSRRAEQQSGPLPSHVREQDCAVIGWAELCGQNLTAKSCFQLQPSSVAGRCQLQGPQRGAAVQLRSARPDHVTTLQTSGELRVTGRIQMISLRFEAGTLSFEDAEIDAQHEVASDPEESIQFGGAFYARNGSFTLSRSRLKVRNTGAVNGGGFAVAGDLRVGQDSQIFIQNVSAKMAAAGFLVNGNAEIYESSLIFIHNARAGQNGGGFRAGGEVVIADRSTLNITNSHAESGDGGGFYSDKKVNVSSSSTVVICNATAGMHGGGFRTYEEVVIADRSTLNITNSRAESGHGGGFFSGKKVNVSSSSALVLCNATAGKRGGGFRTYEEVVIADRSILNITNSRAESGHGGGFYSDKYFDVSSSSTVEICNATAASDQNGGGFAAYNVVIAGRSTLNITNSRAGRGGGGMWVDDLVIADRSNLTITNSRAESADGGGFLSLKLKMSSSSTVVICNATAGRQGGGFRTFGEVVIADRSTVNITNSHAESGDGGGFLSDNKLILSSSSTLKIWNAKAGRSGAGFRAIGKVAITSSAVSIQYARAVKSGGGFIASDNVVIAGRSNISISNGRADQQGGGFQVDGRLDVNDSSTVSLENVTARRSGGGFITFDNVVIARKSTVSIANGRAGQQGGGFLVDGRLHVNDSSIVNLENVTAALGGGFMAGREVVIAGRSTLNITNSRAESGSGGGFHILKDLLLHGSVLFINKSKALQSGTGGRVDGQVLLASESNLVVHGAEGPQDSSVLAASCLHLRAHSNILFESVVGGYGMDLQNDCKKNGGLCNSTLEVAPNATIHASGRLASGLLSVAGCHSEKIHLTGIYLQAWSSPLLSTRGSPGHVVVDQVRIDYAAPVNNLPVLAVEDGYSIDSMVASCGDCAHGVTFNTAKDGKQLLAFSPQNLQCPETATVLNGSTTRCECGNSQITRPDFRDKKMVLLEKSFQTCMFCDRHYYFQNGVCQKCQLFSAWSDGRKDVCHTWPLEQTESMLLFLGPAAVILTIFIAWEIVTAPLTIVEAKSTMADEEKGKRTFTFSVQGPIVHLHKSLSRLVHGRISYRVHGTNLDWLDYNQNSQKVVKVSNLGGRTLILENLAVPFDCGACKGSLHATDFNLPFIVLTGLVTVVVMLPIVISVAATSGNELEHILVTAVLVIIPMALVALVLHVPVACFLRRLYHQTPFREALELYEQQIQCTPYTGPDADHPYNHGLQALTLRGFCQHFEGFILEYNMHFVVSNLVRPLTKSKQIAFVDLWGGRRVDYFVSHSWITGFRHFVRSIHCHALSNDGHAWTDAAYWICSFANNQWNIAAELGTDPMSSAFARVLTNGPKEVAMVLDKEVQPLTRVWCLFEFLLANRHQVDLVFVTDDGVLGTDGCTSFDIALEMGKKIKSLQVATCKASSEKDKKDIFNYIVSQLGSLECMDEQIRSLMGDMLVNNLTNVGRATEDLLKELGQKKTLSYQGSARVAALSSSESSELPAP